MESQGRKGKWGFVNEKGEEVIPLRYDGAADFHNGIVRVKLKRKWGSINEHGKIVVPIRYDEEEVFKEGLSRVKRGSKYGFVDTTGKEVIPIKYKYANHCFENGCCHVVVENLLERVEYTIDKDGNILEQLIYY